VQFLDGHISTFSIKTLVIYLCCAEIHVPVKSWIILLLLLVTIIVVRLFVHCSTFIHSFVRLFVLFDSFAFHSFVVHCSKEKDSILILDCIPSLSIPLYVKCCTRIPSPSMQVNKHHTSDCTNFVLV
jgi:hypothetical protein